MLLIAIVDLMNLVAGMSGIGCGATIDRVVWIGCACWAIVTVFLSKNNECLLDPVQPR